MFAVNTAIDGTEMIHQSFQLYRHPIVIKRCDKYHYIRIKNLFLKQLHIILLNTRAFVSTAHTTGTGMQVYMGRINDLHKMACFFCPSDKFIRQKVRRALFLGLPSKTTILIAPSPPKITHFPPTFAVLIPKIPIQHFPVSYIRSGTTVR